MAEARDTDFYKKNRNVEDSEKNTIKEIEEVSLDNVLKVLDKEVNNAKINQIHNIVQN